jgi:copper resistance protein B
MKKSLTLPRVMLLSVIVSVLAPATMAQNAPAATSSASSPPTSGMDGSSMDRGSMQGMDMGDAPAPAGTAAPAAPVPIKPAHVQGMENMQGMHDGLMALTKGDVMPVMSMGPMQGGGAPPGARSADYSDGIGYGPMRGMDMQDNAPQSMLLIDQLEAVHGNDANGQSWEAEGWYGNDDDKLWLRTEGERSSGRLDDGDVEALWNHTVATYWSSQLGVRQDFGEVTGRHWAAFGVQGLSPYWFELEATGYVGDAGRIGARFRAEYEVLFTQRLILQPELEVNAYGQSDAQRRIGSGLSDAQLGLRLRYEFNRQLAPYVGVVWTRRFGNTADLVRDDHQAIFDRQWVAGIRFWF